MRTPDDSGWRYIVFALEHCTGPFPFNAITCDRDNSNLRPEKGEDDLPDDQKKPAFPPKPDSGKNMTDGELQSDNEPSNNMQSAVVTLPEDRFGVLSSMELEKPEKEMCHYISADAVRPPRFANRCPRYW